MHRPYKLNTANIDQRGGQGGVIRIYPMVHSLSENCDSVGNLNKVIRWVNESITSLGYNLILIEPKPITCAKTAQSRQILTISSVLFLNFVFFFACSYNNIFHSNMTQVATQTYSQLLLRFYQTVARQHPKVNENGSQLHSIFNSDGTSMSKRNSTHYVKKNSRATDCSLSSQDDSLQAQGEGWAKDSLQFTFCQAEKSHQDQFRQQIIKFRYHNPSIFRVVLYSLFFNHLHLRTAPRQGLLHIYRQDQAIVESLMAVLHERVKREGKKDGDGQGSSLQMLAKFMSNVSSGVENVVKRLKKMIDGLDDELVRQVCIATAQQFSTQTDKSTPSQDGGHNQQDDSDVLEMVASQLGLRIGLKDERESVSWGRKESPIYIVIMQSAVSLQFSLKQIVFYQQRQARAGQSGQTLKDSCLKVQMTEI